MLVSEQQPIGETYIACAGNRYFQLETPVLLGQTFYVPASAEAYKNRALSSFKRRLRRISAYRHGWESLTDSPSLCPPRALPSSPNFVAQPPPWPSPRRPRPTGRPAPGRAPPNPKTPFFEAWPEAGTLVVFRSPDFWHEVQRARRTRLSQMGWFLRRASNPLEQVF